VSFSTFSEKEIVFFVMDFIMSNLKCSSNNLNVLIYKAELYTSLLRQHFDLYGTSLTARMPSGNWYV